VWAEVYSREEHQPLLFVLHFIPHVSATLAWLRVIDYRLGHLTIGIPSGNDESAMSEEVLQIDGDAVGSLLQGTNAPVMVEFSAAGCAPCRHQIAVTRQVARRMGERARICVVDIDRNRLLAVRFNIHSVPTLIVFQDAVERERFIGVQSADTLVTALNRWADRLSCPRIDDPEV